jgi:PST family polysaccharide transporter
MSTLSEKTQRAIFWSIGSSGMTNVFQIVFVCILARLLGAHEFGLYAASLVIINFLSLLSEVGIGPAVIQSKQLTSRHIHTALVLSLGLAIIMTLFLFLTASFFAIFFHQPEIKKITIIMALGIPLRGIAIICESLLIREMRFQIYSIIQISSYVIGFGFVALLLAYLGFGVWALVIAHLIQTILESVIIIGLMAPQLRFDFGIKETKELITYGLGSSIGSMAAFFADQSSNVIAGRYLGAANLGFYSRAYQLMVAPAKLLGSQVGKALFPAFSKVQEDNNKIRDIVVGGINIVSLITIPLSTYCIITAHEIIAILLGKGWEPVVRPFQILCVSLVFRSSFRLFDSMAKAIGAVYPRAWRQWVYAIAVCIFTYIGSFWGIDGIASGMTASMLLNFLLMFHLFCSRVSLTWKQAFAAYKPGVILGLLLFCLNFSIYNLFRLEYCHLLIRISIITIASLVLASTMLRICPQFLLYGKGLEIAERMFPKFTQLFSK